MRKNYNQKPRLLLKSCFIIGLFISFRIYNVNAQIQIQEENLGGIVYTDNFTAFEGDADPTNYWISSDVEGAAASEWRGKSTGSSTSGGKYSFGATEEDTDRSLGFLPSGSRAIYYDLEFLNNSGQTIETLSINYIAKQWRSANEGRINGWQVFLIHEGNETEISRLNYRATNTLPTGNIEPTQPLHATEKSGSLTELEILPSDNFTIRFFGDNGAGGGSRQGVGIDDFELSVNVEIEEEDFFTPFTLNTVTLPFTDDFEECTTGFPVNWNVVTPVQSNPNTEAWVCNEFGQTGSGLRASGYAGGERELDSWLISSKFAVEQNTFVIFDLERTFDGPEPQFYVSTTFDGSEWNENLWEQLDVDFPSPAESDGVWNTVSVDLSNYENLDVVIAVRYISNSSGATRLTLDDFNIQTLIDIPISTDEISFTEPVASGTSSTAQSFTILETVTAEDLTLTATSPFALSTSADGPFANSLTLTAAELATETTVFVRFAPNSGFSGVVEGNIGFSINPNVNISLRGLEQGTALPLDYSEDFNEADFFEQPEWQRFQEVGAQNWQITDQTRDDSRPFVARMNGFVNSSGGAQENTTWLISPQINMTTEDEYILMSYDTRSFFNEAKPALKLMVSTNYDRLGDPTDEAYTWTELNGQFPTTTGVWKSTNDINLSAYKNAESLSVAFVYASNPTEGAAEWMVDQFEIITTNETPTPFLSTNNYALTDYHFGVLQPGTSSESRDINVEGQNFQSDVTFTADEGIEISTDGVDFSSKLVVDQAAIANSADYTLQARMTAPADDVVLAQAGGITISTEGLENQRFGYFNHTTIEKDVTFDVVTWNIEWFGDATNATTSNVQTQLDRVKAMILDLDADVYAFQEITNLEIWNQLVNELEGYEGVVSPEASQGADEFEGAQKLTFLFKTATVDTLSTRPLLTGVDVNTDLLNYPGDDPTRFWASGRLPFMMDIVTNIEGVEREISLINVHSRSNGGGESSGNPRYAMRRYDVEVLYDSLEAHYSDRSIILLGDYNDDLDETVADTEAATVPNSGESSFFAFISDADFRATTLPLSEAGMRSFIYNENVIDHITISNELFTDHIIGAERVVIPYSLIPDYNNTASDHFPVEARFKLMMEEEPVFAITEVATSSPIQVALGTPFSQLQLPDSVKVTLEGDSTTLVAVNWNAEDYDPNIVGSNTIEGSLSLKEGITNPDNLAASIEVIVEALAITEVVEFSPIEVNLGTSFSQLQLPDSVQVTLEGDSTTLVAINWSAENYNPNIVGSNTIEGILSLKEGIANPDNLTASIEVSVEALAITELREFTPLEVAFGTPFTELELPSSTFVTLENGDTTLLSINWIATGYDESEANTYSILGELVLTEEISNPENLRASIEVTVLEEVTLSIKDRYVDFGLVNYPNPFTETTTIAFSTKIAGPVKVRVLDMMGRTVSTVLDKSLAQGNHKVEFERNNLPTGVYFYSIETNDGNQTNRMIAR